MIENIIVKTRFFVESDKQTLFGDEEVMYVEPDTTLTDLVCNLGLFKSKSQARQAGRVGEIPEGWTVMKGNKKTPLYIWNPVL